MSFFDVLVPVLGFAVNQTAEPAKVAFKEALFASVNPFYAFQSHTLQTKDGEITTPSFQNAYLGLPDMPDIETVGKYALYAVAGIAGIYLIGKYIGRGK